MRRFLVFALIGLVLLFVAGRLFGGGGEPNIEPGSTLVIDLSGSYVETQEPSLIGRLLGSPARPFVGLLSRLTMAERDDRLGSVVLRIENVNMGWGKVQEVRAAIGRLRAAGRHTVAYIEIVDFAASREYFLASAADEVYVVPGAIMPLVGLAAEYLYLGGLWDKLGIDFQVAKAGRYKSAVEFYAGDGMSEASREMANALLDSTERQFVAGVAAARGLSEQHVRTAFDRGLIRVEEMVELGLVDGERHFEDITDELGGETIEGREYAAVDPATVGFEAKASFALIYGSGLVQSGDGTTTPGGEPVFAAKAVTRALEAAAEDDEIEAIVLRIDSPGGSALASELMWRAVMDAKESSGKPVIASFSDLAASGGYYVAVAADAIVSQGATLTGSIGVFALRPLLDGFLDKLGIEVENLTRGGRSDFVLSSSPLSDGARELLQSSVSEMYELFLKRVAAGRSLDRDAVDAIAQGRVWTGEDALAHGLVDEIGGLREAVTRAKVLAGYDEDDDVVLVPYPQPKPLAEEIAELLDARAASAVGDPGDLLRAGRALLAARALPAPLAILETWLTQLPSNAPLLMPPVLVDIR